MKLVSSGGNPQGPGNEPAEFLIWTFDHDSKLHKQIYMVEAINAQGEFLVADIRDWSTAYRTAIDHINS